MKARNTENFWNFAKIKLTLQFWSLPGCDIFDISTFISTKTLMDAVVEEKRAEQISEVSLSCIFTRWPSLPLSLSLSNCATNSKHHIRSDLRLQVSQGQIMPPSRALQSDSQYQDLDFLKEIKNEVLVNPSNITNNSNSNNEQDHSELSVYLGMRRNSSFADYFEGDLSQNLLSRRHFSESSSTKSGIISTLVNKIRVDGQTRSKVEGDGMLGRNSEVFF